MRILSTVLTALALLVFGMAPQATAETSGRKESPHVLSPENKAVLSQTAKKYRCQKEKQAWIDSQPEGATWIETRSNLIYNLCMGK
jgi:hypothetical protein